MEKIFELSRKLRLAIFVIAIIAIVISNNSDAFYPPDCVPHLELPDPVTPGDEYEDEDGVRIS